MYLVHKRRLEKEEKENNNTEQIGPGIWLKWNKTRLECAKYKD